MTVCRLVASIFLILFTCNTYALSFDLPANDDNVVGQISYAHSLSGEKLADVGRRFDIGYYEMVEANPSVNAEQTLTTWTSVLIPGRFVLPPKPHEGIVINLAELRLYYFPKDENKVITEPVGIGRVGWNTPLGETKIIEKKEHPYWHPPKAVREDAEKQGYILPRVWPPGPDNPLGTRMMRLGWPTYLIHGTNHPEGVGKRSSAGCIRMFPEDVETLYDWVKVGTPVRVINNPIKVGWEYGKIILEAHKPLQEKGKFVTDDTRNLVERITTAIGERHVAVRWRAAQEAVKRQSGMPVEIGAESIKAPDVITTTNIPSEQYERTKKQSVLSRFAESVSKAKDKLFSSKE